MYEWAMTTKAKQRGFIDIPRGFFEVLFTLAALGAVTLLGLAGWGLWWLVTHVRFVA